MESTFKCEFNQIQIFRKQINVKKIILRDFASKNSYLTYTRIVFVSFKKYSSCDGMIVISMNANVCTVFIYFEKKFKSCRLRVCLPIISVIHRQTEPGSLQCLVFREVSLLGLLL